MSKNSKNKFYELEFLDLETKFKILDNNRIVFVNHLTDNNDNNYDELTAKTAERIYREILALYIHNPYEPILLFIVNNAGGDFYGMLAVYELIESLKKYIPIYTFVFGYAYSAAAFLFLAGSKRFITPQSRLMLHYGQTTISGDPYTTKRWFRESEKILELQEKMLIQCYKMNGDRQTRLKEIRNILAADSVFSGLDAIKNGLATDLFDPQKLLDILKTI